MKNLKLLLLSFTIAFASCTNDKPSEEKEKEKPEGPKIIIDKYILSEDGKNGVTVLHIDGRVSFINGKDTSVLREGYIQSTNGLAKDYSCDFTWKNDTCYIQSIDVDLKVVGNPKKIFIKKASDPQ